MTVFTEDARGHQIRLEIISGYFIGPPPLFFVTQIGILILQHSRELHYNFCMHAIKSSGVYCAGVTFEICIKSSKTSPKKAICDKNEEEDYYFFSDSV